jgi:hypothetical protein
MKGDFWISYNLPGYPAGRVTWYYVGLGNCWARVTEVTDV